MQAKLQHLINVFHSVEKIEKILFAQPGSTDIEIYMEGSRYKLNFMYLVFNGSSDIYPTEIKFLLIEYMVMKYVSGVIVCSYSAKGIMSIFPSYSG